MNSIFKSLKARAELQTPAAESFLSALALWVDGNQERDWEESEKEVIFLCYMHQRHIAQGWTEAHETLTVQILPIIFPSTPLNNFVNHVSWMSSLMSLKIRVNIWSLPYSHQYYFYSMNIIRTQKIQMLSVIFWSMACRILWIVLRGCQVWCASR